jgi:hypothetical protein
MTATPKVAMWAQGAFLALMLAVFAGSARAQGTIVYVVPQQPIYYAPIDHSTDIDLNGDGIADYTLISDPTETVLQAHGQNSMVVVPELPPDYGSFVAPLSQGDAVNSTPSSLNPVFAWYDASTDPFNPLIAAMNTAGSLGYTSLTAYTMSAWNSSTGAASTTDGWRSTAFSPRFQVAKFSVGHMKPSPTHRFSSAKCRSRARLPCCSFPARRFGWCGSVCDQAERTAARPPPRTIPTRACPVERLAMPP